MTHSALKPSALFGLILFASTAVAAPEPSEHRGYEGPAYTVERREGNFELRTYAPHLLAEVTVEGNRNSAARRGFRTLAGYIFGGNDEKQKIAMTSPVTQAPQTETGDQWEIRFMMPSDFDESSLPNPDNKAIRFTRTSQKQEAVVRFSGRWTNANLERQTKALSDWLLKSGIKTVGPARYYFYDDPFTLPSKRRNEVAFTVTGAR